jgi:hypothetical protein
MNRAFRFTALPLALLVVVAGTAAAGQQVRTPKAGEEVVVTQTDSGDEMLGRIVNLSPESLALLVNGQRVDVPIEKVLRIDGRRDSLVNGAVIGAAVLGGWCAFICGQGLDSNSSLPAAVAVNAGLGALIGVGFDALHKGRSPIYVKPAKAGSALQVRIRF